ncbi:hypothetical protein A4X13_0g6881 [Tilletia indica]|uniref:Reverse transcriptase domain-containing protein n=1 Tax=Tilletia indica TaxID=43049 RepID=A0A8T8SPE4_9BASI|nr:hypothetical protein A4X13_0g6881 [Tilletia indica]
MELLRSQKDAVEDMITRIGDKSKALSEDGDIWSNLRIKAEALRTVPLAHCEKAKECAGKALAFLKWQDDFACHRSVKAAEEWSRRLDAQIASVRHQAAHAILFSDALQQWIDTDGKDSAEDDLLGGAKSHGGTNETVLKEAVPFAPEPSGGFNARDFLKRHGATQALLKVLDDSRVETRKFGEDVLNKTVTTSEVKVAMESLAADVKQHGQDMCRQLLDESRKPLVLGELSEAFTSTWRTIERWEWPASGIAQIPQVHLNGKERMHLQLDIVQAVFLQVVGAKWAGHFTQVLHKLHRSESWPVVMELGGVADDDKAVEEMMDHQSELLQRVCTSRAHIQTLNDFCAGGLLQEREQSFRSSATEMLTRSNSAGGFAAAYEGSEDVVGAKDNCAWKTGVSAQVPAQTYAQVYQKMQADMQLLRIGAPGSKAAFLHADLRDFGASVPHKVILDVLQFFGLPPQWLAWYGTYLRIPMRSSTEVHKSQRGTPFGLLATAVADELLLVVLDIALACAADVTALRNHDDVWVCNDLPENPLRWGVLLLQEDGHWGVDNDLVDSQAEAARRELANSRGARSLLGKVNIYNRYAAFFVRNCGVPMGFSGDTFVDAYRSVIHRFDTAFTGGKGVFAWLSAELSSAFPQHAGGIELQEAMFMWPLRLGGFELHPHEMIMFLHHKNLEDSEKEGEGEGNGERSSLMTLESDCRTEYEELREVWDSAKTQKEFRSLVSGHGTTGLRAWAEECGNKQPDFIRFDQYLRHSLLHSHKWAEMHRTILAAKPCDPSKLEKLMLEMFTDALCESFGSLHEHSALVATALVPQYAVLDVQAATKQRFNAN